MERWRMGDPFEVYARIEEQERRKLKMTKDQSEQVEHLLDQWYRWAKAQREFLSYSKVSPMFRGVEADSGDVHSTGSDIDDRLHCITSEMVEACLCELKVMERAAIEVHMRNKVQAVHRNPRLGTVEQQHQAYLDAKEQLFPILKRKGLVHISKVA